MTCIINGHQFDAIPGVRYLFDYEALARQISRGEREAREVWRTVLKHDLFFILYFVMGYKTANHPFVVAACNEVQEGPVSDTVDIWAREHFKCVEENQLVYMADGTLKAMKDVQVGDMVMGLDNDWKSSVYPVVAKSERSLKKCIQFTSGAGQIVVSEDHRMMTGAGFTVAKDVDSKKHSFVTPNRLNLLADKDVTYERLRQLKNLREDYELIPDDFMRNSKFHDEYLNFLFKRIGFHQTNRGFGFISPSVDVLYQISNLLLRRGVCWNFALRPYGEGARKRMMWFLRLMNNTQVERFLKEFPMMEDYEQWVLQGASQVSGEKSSFIGVGWNRFRKRTANGFYPPYPTHDASGKVLAMGGASVRQPRNSRDKVMRLLEVEPNEDLQRYVDGDLEHVLITDKKAVGEKWCYDIQVGGGMEVFVCNNHYVHNSSIITVSESIQDICKDPNIRIGIFSYNRDLAATFLRSIQYIATNSEFLKWLFPDIFYANPDKEAYRWSEDTGLWVKRDSFAREGTVECSGLIEGMPVGRHYTKMIYDDVMTQDFADSLQQKELIKDRFDMSLSLGAEGGRKRFVGTFYAHDDPYVYICGKKDEEGNPIYTLRLKPATDNGEANGNPLLMSMKRLREVRAGKQYIFDCQYLCNPTPHGTRKLDGSLLQMVSQKDLPKELYKFVSIDPAGSGGLGVGDDNWGIVLMGAVPYLNDTGASDIYLLDIVAEKLEYSEALVIIANMYMNNGYVRAVGVEKVGLSTMEVHIQNYLKSKGRHISLDDKSLILNRPGGRKKGERIYGALNWPLKSGTIKVLDTIPEKYVTHLKEEMNKFPRWKDDVLDAISYGYDMLKELEFTWTMQEKEQYQDYHSNTETSLYNKLNSWMVQ